MGYTENMSITVEKVVSEALELPPSVRAFVAKKLIESLDIQEAPRLSAKWKTGLRRRCTEVDQGAVSLHTAPRYRARTVRAGQKRNV